MYRVGFPGWKIAARAGFPLHLRVAVHHDPEVDVYWATSTDLRGLVVEAKTMDALVNEVQCGIDTLVEDMFPSSAPIQPVTDLRIDRSVCAA